MFDAKNVAVAETDPTLRVRSADALRPRSLLKEPEEAVAPVLRLRFPPLMASPRRNLVRQKCGWPIRLYEQEPTGEG